MATREYVNVVECVHDQMIRRRTFDEVKAVIQELRKYLPKQCCDDADELVDSVYASTANITTALSFFRVLRHAWRTLPWGDNKSNLHYAEQYQPKCSNVHHLRVLLYGPVGAGRSSFINSISSTLRGRITISAGASATTSVRNHTRKYKTHKIKKETGEYYSMVFNDIMGLEDGSGNGVRVEDIKLAMMGHVNEGYKFNPISAQCEGDPCYNPSPTLNDKVHVLVCVHSANYIEIKESVLEKMRMITEMASDMEIPQIAVITKVDEACGETEKDLKNVYKSKRIKNRMSDISSALGIPMNCIFPIKNYSEENSTNDEVDTLILDALRAILNFGDDFLDQL